jgi:hypothetical protein
VGAVDQAGVNQIRSYKIPRHAESRNLPRGEQEMAMALMQQGRTDKTLQLTSQGSE